MSEPAVLYEAKDYVATITLNRPENRNSMTDDVLEGLRACVARVKEDPELRCVIVTGRGKSFCAGADFKSGAQRDGGSARKLLTTSDRSPCTAPSSRSCRSRFR